MSAKLEDDEPLLFTLEENGGCATPPELDHNSDVALGILFIFLFLVVNN